MASLAAGVLAALLTRLYVSAKDAEIREFKDEFYRKAGGPVDVLCFLRDIPGGTVLSEEDLGHRVMPAMGMRGQAVPKGSAPDVIGRRTVFGHKRGEIVFWTDVEGGDPSVKGLSADVKRQMRAVSINCTGAASVSGMVRPNDHVDVIGTFDLSDSGAASRTKSLVTCTILQNVLVLATGSQTAKSQAGGTGLGLGGPSGYATVTLEVTPREAEMLAFSEQIKGRLMLALRNRNDASYERELPKVDFEMIRGEIEALNLRRQQQKLTTR